MNKLLVFISFLLVLALIYLLFSARRTNPLVKVPDVVGQPTQAPTAAPLDFSKVKIEDVKVGTGALVTDGSQVSVQYRGTLTDGTEFDSSYSRDNQPLTFTVGVGEMIPGFDYGVKGMKVGGTRKITIPPELGYGAQDRDPIPANSTLIFEVTLEKVE